MICVECNTLLYGVQRVAEIAAKIEEKLTEIFEFLRVKASQNIVLGSYPFSNDKKSHFSMCLFGIFHFHILFHFQ